MTALADAAADYLALRRRLGHDLADAHRLLPRFVAYLDGIGAVTVTIEAAVAWSMAPDVDPASSVWPRRMIVARGFARHMAGIDPATEVPPVGLIPSRQRWRPPFLFTGDDVERLVAAASSVVRWRLPAATHSTLIGLLAVTGMRVGEALKLDDADLDWDDGVVQVRESKFGKSRIVPLDHEHPRRPPVLRGDPRRACRRGRSPRCSSRSGEPDDLRRARRRRSAGCATRPGSGPKRRPAPHS